MINFNLLNFKIRVQHLAQAMLDKEEKTKTSGIFRIIRRNDVSCEV